MARPRERTFQDRSVVLDLPLRILVTGDTHLGARRTWLPDPLLQCASAADMIVHTGDFCTRAAKELFEWHGPVLAVRGNNDDAALMTALPDRLFVTAGERRVLITHGHLERGTSARNAVQKTYGGELDLVIYGHSHQPCWEEVRGSWFLNPGSPTMRRREPRFSFAVLEFDRTGEFSVSITHFD
jgi:uncharacterized protein